MSEEPKRWLWLDETQQGPFPVTKMFRMATAGDIGPTTLFWSDAKQQWLPLTGVMFDIEPSRLNEMASAGIEKIEVLGSRQDDCAACSALAGKSFPIAGAPDLPPGGCECVPWCRLTIGATE